MHQPVSKREPPSDLWSLNFAVISGSDLPCYESEYLEVGAASGYLASVVTDRTGRGSVDCPWLIRAEPWQRINLTLWDFAASGSVSYSIPGSSGEAAGIRDVTLIGTHCHKYAVIHEKLVIRETIVCGDLQREKVVYVSTTNEVSVEITRYNVPKKPSYFLLHFNSKWLPTDFNWSIYLCILLYCIALTHNDPK